MSCCAARNDERAQQQDGGGTQSRQSRVARQESIKWRIRPMRHEDIGKCLEIWRQVELTEAHLTVASVLATDPRGLWVAELEPNGDVIGMCSGAMTREDTAFMGFYAVEPEFQGIGIGRELWARTLARLDKSSHNIGLYGVPGMSEKYKKSGFKLEDSIRMIIYESRPGEQLNVNHLKRLHELHEEPQTVDDCCWRLEIINGRTSAMLIKRLIDYDERVNRYSREKLLRTYLTDGAQVPLTVAIVRSLRQTAGPAGTIGGGQCQWCHFPASGGSNSQTLVSSVGGAERKSSCCLRPSQHEAIKEDEALSTSVRGSLSISAINNVGSDLQLRSSSPIDIPSVSSIQQQQQHLHHQSHQHHHHHFEFMGYGCIRHDNTDGAMIGPVYARSSDVYEVILRELVDRFDMRPGGKYSAMSLSSNMQAAKVLERIGFEELDQCSRMFTKFVPEASLEQVYLVHSPNFTLF